jgi:hypothetical protein
MQDTLSIFTIAREKLIKSSLLNSKGNATGAIGLGSSNSIDKIDRVTY